MLSIASFNALLKMLEEPPAHAIFILATTEINKVPATIISRCQRFDFKKVNAADLFKRLAWICQEEKVKVSQDVLREIVRHSEGALRDAESLLGQILALGEKEITLDEASLVLPRSNYNLVLDLINQLVYKNAEGGIALVNKLADEGIDLVKYDDDLVEFIRKIMLAKISGGLKSFAFDLDEDLEHAILELAQKFQLDELVSLINIFSGKKFEIKTAVIPQLPLEIGIIEYCKEGAFSAPGGASEDKGKGFLGGSGGGVGLKKLETKSENKSDAASATLKNENLAAIPRQIKKINLTLDEIKSKWHNFLVKLQESNASLVFILKVADPLVLEGNILKIGFKYPFHQQRVCQPKVQVGIEKALADFFQAEIYLETCLLPKEFVSEIIEQETKNDEVELVDEVKPGEALDQQALIDTLVKTFNGKVIE